MQDARVRGALIFICLACLLGSGWVLLRGRQTTPAVVFSAPAAVVGAASVGTPAAVAAPRPVRLFVDVAGSVRRPSLYVLPPHSRVMQAILAAGGPTASADIDAVNLAEPVTDGEKVFVPMRGAAPRPSQTAPARPTVPASLPLPGLPAASTKSGKSKSNSSGRSSKINADSGEQIGLNSATLEELERLPGVGPSMAAKILAYRQESGGFAKIDDLTLVPGIGPKKLAKITPFVSLN